MLSCNILAQLLLVHPLGGRKSQFAARCTGTACASLPPSPALTGSNAHRAGYVGSQWASTLYRQGKAWMPICLRSTGTKLFNTHTSTSVASHGLKCNARLDALSKDSCADLQETVSVRLYKS
jgi:hypothetical protein